MDFLTSKSKSAKNNSISATQFIVSMPVDDVIQQLANHSKIVLEAVLSDHANNFRVSYADESYQYAVLLSVNPWNGTDTRITIGQTLLSAKSQRSMTSYMIITCVVLSFILFFVLGKLAGMLMLVLVFVLTLATGHNSNYSQELSKILIEEKLTNEIVGLLTQNTESVTAINR